MNRPPLRPEKRGFRLKNNEARFNFTKMYTKTGYGRKAKYLVKRIYIADRIVSVKQIKYKKWLKKELFHKFTVAFPRPVRYFRDIYILAGR